MMSGPAAAELENHLGISEKTLAEFIVDLAKGCKDTASFKKTLSSNGAEIPDGVQERLFTIIKSLSQQASLSCIQCRTTN